MAFSAQRDLRDRHHQPAGRSAGPVSRPLARGGRQSYRTGNTIMTEAFLCDAIRTPIGAFGGALAAVRADDLAAHDIKALVARHPKLDPAAIDDVIIGCANQAGE